MQINLCLDLEEVECNVPFEVLYSMLHTVSPIKTAQEKKLNTSSGYS